MTDHSTIDEVRTELHRRGMRWTPQRRALLEVLFASDGHRTGADLVDACRAIDPETTPSTVYRTLDVLEELGVVCHSHGYDGREEFHVLPLEVHGHLACQDCGATWEIDAAEARKLTGSLLRERGFSLNLSHLTIVGRCADCTSRQQAAAAS